MIESCQPCGDSYYLDRFGVLPTRRRTEATPFEVLKLGQMAKNHDLPGFVDGSRA